MAFVCHGVSLYESMRMYVGALSRIHHDVHVSARTCTPQWRVRE